MIAVTDIMVTSITAVIGGSITTLGVIIVAMLQRQNKKAEVTHKHVEAISDSVNHRHAKNNGKGLMDLSLDMARDVAEVKVGMVSLQEEVGTLTERVDTLQTDPPCRIHSYSDEEIQRILKLK